MGKPHKPHREIDNLRRVIVSGIRISAINFSRYFRNVLYTLQVKELQNQLKLQTNVNLRVICNNIKQPLDQGWLKNRSGLPIKNHKKNPQVFLKEAKVNLCEITQV